MLNRLMLVVALASVVALAGCSGDESSTETSAETTDEAATTESTVIILEEGWAIQDVLAPEEVGEIVGATLVYFPEGASASQDGEPVASYLQEDVENSKVRFAVDVDGGTAEYEAMKGFAVEGSVEEISGLGEEAVALEYEDGNVGVLVRNGEAVISVMWQGSVYGTGAAEVGTQLAELLMAKMYGE
jgi:hypothetical protein